MDFTSKASITLTGVMSAAAVVAAASSLPGFSDAVLSVAQAEAEASKSAGGLTLVDRQVTMAEDGTATVDLVFEKVETTALADASQDAPQAEQQAAQAGAPPPVVPLSLTPLGLTPAAV